ncbi:MAG: NAD(P)-binding domain-containing protein [Aeromicrobium sp.]
MKITVIGSGTVGRTVSAGLASRDHDVTLSSRSPDAQATWASETGVRVNAPPGSSAGADVIVNATPGQSSIEALEGAGVKALGKVVVLDLSNPLDFSTGTPRLSTGVDESQAEAIQAAFPEARVVKTLNTVNANVMTNPASLSEPSVQFVCGNDSEAKKTVTDLLLGLGWQTDQIIDLGDLSAARDTERYLMLWLRLMGSLGTAAFNIKLVRD